MLSLKTFLPIGGILAYLSLVSCASYLQCYRCAWSKASSSGITGSVLSFFEKLKDTSCLLKNAGDANNLDIVHCKEPAHPLEVAKCAILKGTVTGDYNLGIADVSTKYDTFSRDCVLVEPENEDTKDGCHNNPPLSGPIGSLVKSSHASSDLGNIKVDGQACYSSGSEVQGGEDGGLICYHCSWGKLLTENAIIKTLLSAFYSLSDDSCRLRNEDSDTYAITARLCKQPEDDNKVAKCASVEGLVTGKYSVIGIEVKYVTLVRDCIIVDKSDENYFNGRHDNPPFSGALKAMLTTLISTVSLGKMEFQGFAVYEQQLIHSVSQTDAGGHMLAYPSNFLITLCLCLGCLVASK